MWLQARDASTGARTGYVAHEPAPCGMQTGCEALDAAVCLTQIVYEGRKLLECLA